MNFGLESFRFNGRAFLGSVSDRFPASVYLVLVRASSSSQFHSPSAKWTLVARYRPEPTTFAAQLPAPIRASAAKNNISERSRIKANQVRIPQFPRDGVPNNDSVTSAPMVGSR